MSVMGRTFWGHPDAQQRVSAAHGGEVVWGLALLYYEFGRGIVILGATFAKSCAAVLLLPPPLTLAMT